MLLQFLNTHSSFQMWCVLLAIFYLMFNGGICLVGDGGNRAADHIVRWLLGAPMFLLGLLGLSTLIASL